MYEVNIIKYNCQSNHTRRINPPEINAFLTGELSPQVLSQYQFKSGNIFKINKEKLFYII